MINRQYTYLAQVDQGGIVYGPKMDRKSEKETEYYRWFTENTCGKRDWNSVFPNWMNFLSSMMCCS